VKQLGRVCCIAAPAVGLPNLFWGLGKVDCCMVFLGCCVGVRWKPLVGMPALVVVLPVVPGAGMLVTGMPAMVVGAAIAGMVGNTLPVEMLVVVVGLRSTVVAPRIAVVVCTLGLVRTGFDSLEGWVHSPCFELVWAWCSFDYLSDATLIVVCRRLEGRNLGP
jgi:hypothetical protein